MLARMSQTATSIIALARLFSRTLTIRSNAFSSSGSSPSSSGVNMSSNATASIRGVAPVQASLTTPSLQPMAPSLVTSRSTMKSAALSDDDAHVILRA